MRNVNRIKPFLEKVEQLWILHPDLRFGQVIYILQDRLNKDIFNPEEDEWLKVIQSEIDSYKPWE